MTTSEYAELSLKEKEEYWIKAMKHKCGEYGEQTTEQYDYEMEPAILYEDDNLYLFKRYGVEIEVGSKKDKNKGWCAGFWILEDREAGDIGRVLQDEKYNGMSFIDYMRTKGFPLT